MIVGIGTDLVEIERIRRAYERNNSFKNRFFTENECKLIGENMTKLADNFAVKEAVSKVFGTGIIGFELIDIEVLRNEFGKPYVNLYNNAEKIARELGINRIYISITNTKIYSQAFAIGESDNL